MLRRIHSIIKYIIFKMQQIVLSITRYMYYMLLILLVLNFLRFHGPRFLAARYILSRFYAFLSTCISTREYYVLHKYIYKSRTIRALRRYFWPILA